jgi:hypothetical protein
MHEKFWLSIDYTAERHVFLQDNPRKVRTFLWIIPLKGMPFPSNICRNILLSAGYTAENYAFSWYNLRKICTFTGYPAEWHALPWYYSQKVLTFHGFFAASFLFFVNIWAKSKQILQIFPGVLHRPTRYCSWKKIKQDPKISWYSPFKGIVLEICLNFFWHQTHSLGPIDIM